MEVARIMAERGNLRDLLNSLNGIIRCASDFDDKTICAYAGLFELLFEKYPEEQKRIYDSLSYLLISIKNVDEKKGDVLSDLNKMEIRSRLASLFISKLDISKVDIFDIEIVLAYALQFQWHSGSNTHKDIKKKLKDFIDIANCNKENGEFLAHFGGYVIKHCNIVMLLDILLESGYINKCQDQDLRAISNMMKKSNFDLEKDVKDVSKYAPFSVIAAKVEIEEKEITESVESRIEAMKNFLKEK